MAYFLFIMVVFLLAYGVASHAILYPQGEPSWSLISKIFFRPYFQIYGELFLESLEDTSAQGEAKNAENTFDSSHLKISFILPDA